MSGAERQQKATVLLVCVCLRRGQVSSLLLSPIIDLLLRLLGLPLPPREEEQTTSAEFASPSPLLFSPPTPEGSFMTGQTEERFVPPGLTGGLERG